MEKIFNDILTKEDIKRAQNDIYQVTNCITSLKEEVENSIIGLNDLLMSIKQMQKSIEFTPYSYLIESSKLELDKVAYLMENFVTEFKPIYESIYSRHAAETLSGSNENKKVTFNVQASQTLHTHTNVPSHFYFAEKDKLNGWKQKE